MKRAAFPVLLGLVVAALLGLFALGDRRSNEPAESRDRLGVIHEDQGQQHIPDDQQVTTYNSNPASSGPHYGAPAPWGAKTVEVPDERFVHNLEHGGVVVTYRPDLSADQLARLKEIVDALPPSPQFNKVKVIFAPRSKNTAPIQLAAWRYTLDLQTPDANQIRDFYSDHIDQGPELVP